MKYHQVISVGILLGGYGRQIVDVYVEKKVMVLVYLHVGNGGGISLHCTALLKIG